MYINETYAKKWAPVLDHPELPAISDPYKRAVTALVLENQERALQEESRSMQNLWEAAPANAMGTAGITGLSGATNSGITGFDPVLIGLVRRALPNLMAYDICGVQPMTGPTGLIFAMRSVYATSSARGGEALFNEANNAHSGNGTMTAFSTTVNPGTDDATVFGLANTGYGFTTAYAEDATLAYMGFQIDRVAVTANSRGLQAAYTLELAQDLKAVHGLDAETELTNILSTEILAEINREVVRTIYATANVGITGVSSNVVNLSSSTISDAAGGTSGRWQAEKYKSLLFRIEQAANKIAKDTRRGKGNMLIVSTDVASALAMTGLLDYNSALSNNTNLMVDDTGNTFAGVLFGRIKVYVDPYSVSGADYVVVGYKGQTPYDAGLFYCPYVPLQMVRAVDPTTYQPKVGFKTRYGLVANPFATGAGTGALANGTNLYYRKFRVLNINQ
jgi:hypothetical protein